MNNSSRWQAEPQWFLWEGGFLVLGRSDGVVPRHAHHAIQVVIGIDAPVAIAEEEGEWRIGHGVLVPPDHPHRFDARGALGAMIFVDPESDVGTWLRKSMGKSIAVAPGDRMAPGVEALRTYLERPLEAMPISSLVRFCVELFCVGAPPARRLDPRVTTVLRAIRDSEDLRIPLESGAATAGLSPSRFQHLFRQQVGLPFRRYILWRKLTRAMLSIGRERTLTDAAHASDFADAAHLTRTFNHMFGIPPSVMMRGEFAVIDPPFDA